MAENTTHNRLNSGADAANHQLTVAAVADPGQTADKQHQPILLLVRHNHLLMLTSNNLCKFIQVLVHLAQLQAAETTQRIAALKLRL